MNECRMVMDLWVGTCHGVPVVAYCLFSNLTVYDNEFQDVRTTDILSSSCPICGSGIALAMSPDVFAEELGITRLGDSCVFGAGSGLAATGSPDVFANM